MYSALVYSVRNTLQDPQGKPEILTRTEPSMYYVPPYTKILLISLNYFCTVGPLLSKTRVTSTQTLQYYDSGSDNQDDN